MSDVLLQTIVEKLESLEIALLKDDNASKDKDERLQKTLLQEVKSVQSQIANLSSQFKTGPDKMEELLKGLSALNVKLDKPLSNQIKHSHHLHKGIWVSIGLFIISLMLLYGWIDYSTTKKQSEANDIKFRYLKVSGNSNLLKLLNYTDSLYNVNPDSLANLAAIKERSVKPVKLVQRTGQKKKNIK